jgi:hypothetical protein
MFSGNDVVMSSVFVSLDLWLPLSSIGGCYIDSRDHSPFMIIFSVLFKSGVIC